MHKIIKLLTLSFSANIKHGQGNIRCLYKLYLISFGINIFQASMVNIMRIKAWYVIGYVKLGKVYCTYILHLVTHVLLHSKPESNT